MMEHKIGHNKERYQKKQEKFLWKMIFGMKYPLF